MQLGCVPASAMQVKFGLPLLRQVLIFVQSVPALLRHARMLLGAKLRPPGCGRKAMHCDRWTVGAKSPQAVNAWQKPTKSEWGITVGAGPGFCMSRMIMSGPIAMSIGGPI